MRPQFFATSLFFKVCLTCAGILPCFYFIFFKTHFTPNNKIAIAIEVNQVRGRRLIVPERAADAPPVSTEVNPCQFKAEQRRSNSCFSYRVARDGREALTGRKEKKKKSIHLRWLMADCGKSMGKKSIAQLFDCFTCHRSVRCLRGVFAGCSEQGPKLFLSTKQKCAKKYRTNGGKVRKGLFFFLF